jgi:hypothetical protein
MRQLLVETGFLAANSTLSADDPQLVLGNPCMNGWRPTGYLHP